MEHRYLAKNWCKARSKFKTFGQLKFESWQPTKVAHSVSCLSVTHTHTSRQAALFCIECSVVVKACFLLYKWTLLFYVPNWKSLPKAGGSWLVDGGDGSAAIRQWLSGMVSTCASSYSCILTWMCVCVCGVCAFDWLNSEVLIDTGVFSSPPKQKGDIFQWSSHSTGLKIKYMYIVFIKYRVNLLVFIGFLVSFGANLLCTYVHMYVCIYVCICVHTFIHTMMCGRSHTKFRWYIYTAHTPAFQCYDLYTPSKPWKKTKWPSRWI